MLFIPLFIGILFCVELNIALNSHKINIVQHIQQKHENNELKLGEANKKPAWSEFNSVVIAQSSLTLFFGVMQSGQHP